MIVGRIEFHVEALPQEGDRRDFRITVEGPGQTSYSFPLSITGTIGAVWNLLEERAFAIAAEELARTIIDVHGTASAPPAEGYWFDSFNSENSISDTGNKIRDIGELSFRKNRTVSDELGRALSLDVLNTLDRVNRSFISSRGEPLVQSIDSAFEASEAQEDLGTFPDDKPGFMYRICILSVIIDRFGIRLPAENRGTRSLAALRNWASEQFGPGGGDSLTETFKMIKYLRKQYPIHEHYEETVEDQRVVRSEITQARKFFGLRDGDHAGNWNKIVDAFVRALAELEQTANSHTGVPEPR